MFRICINTPSGSSSRECCIPAQDCFKGPRLAAVAEPQAPQVGTIEQSKVEKAISIRGSATLWATTEAPAEPEQWNRFSRFESWQKYIFHLCIHDILRIYEILTTPVNTSSAIFIMIQASIILTKYSFIQCCHYTTKECLLTHREVLLKKKKEEAIHSNVSHLHQYS